MGYFFQIDSQIEPPRPSRNPPFTSDRGYAALFGFAALAVFAELAELAGSAAEASAEKHRESGRRPSPKKP